MIHPGTQERMIAQVTTGSGSTTKEGVIQSDSLLATLWVNSVTSGTLDVSVYTLTDNGKEVLLFSFPTISGATTDLLLKKSGVSMARFRIVATYSGVCDYEVYVRAVEGAGESNTRILGSSSWRVTQEDVTNVPALLIPAALVDRNGVLIKNWGTSGNIFVAETLAKVTANIETYPIGPRDALAMDIGAGNAVYAVADVPLVDIRIAESGT